ncbi:CRISPR-associated endonuclease Cas2 [Flaviflexus huanghaiensis]|uniref:CRISPR-associated endonuclease Cas2 n=1 Tax=Flaviflexus huanghaiensis TaxID=1111473 RepID=UPI0015FA2CD7|nr:CRISPR-associated endonuclease Cas2 [Flaviflexus huanghaiensis]
MTRNDSRRYLIAYDIPDDRRRARISKALGSYGERMQFSVFLLDLNPVALVSLTDELEDLMDSAEDALLICDLGASHDANQRSITSLGRQAELPKPQSFVI